MLRGLTLIAVLGSVAIAVGYVATKGGTKPHEYHRIQPASDSQITIVSYPVGISFKRNEPIASHEKVHNQLDEILRDRGSRIGGGYMTAPFKLTSDNSNGIYQMDATAKRSMAIGRTGWRPGKRSNEKPSQETTAVGQMFWLDEVEQGQPEQVYEATTTPEPEQKPSDKQKRSLAIGRAQWRPGKRAIPIAVPTFDSPFAYSYDESGAGSGYYFEQ